MRPSERRAIAAATADACDIILKCRKQLPYRSAPFLFLDRVLWRIDERFWTEMGQTDRPRACTPGKRENHNHPQARTAGAA